MRRFLFHNFRIFFALSHWTQQHLTSAGFLVFGSLILAAVFGVDTQKTLAYQLFSLLLALLLLAMLSSLFFKIRLTAQRDLPKFATVGEILHYQVRIKNHTKKLQRSLTLQENFKWQPPSFDTFLSVKEPGHKKRNWFDNYVGYPRWLWLMNLGKGAEVAVSHLPPLSPKNANINLELQSQKEKNQNSELEVTMTLTPLRRGYVHFTRMIFARPDPFGLFKALYTFEKSDSLLILPKRYVMGEIRFVGAKKYQRGGVQLAMSVGDAEEFMALRDYRPGDPLRHIHWKSWAKAGKPIVKEFQDEFLVRQALILDTFTEQTVSDVFESAVSVATSFACAPRSHEVLLDLMFVGTQAYRFTSGRGLTQTDKLLEVLACVDACTKTNFEQLSSLVLEHIASLSGCICILIHWNAARQQFIHSLKSAGIPLLVIILSHTELEIDVSQFPEVHVLLLDNIADGLKKITYTS